MSISSFSLSFLYLTLHFTIRHNEIVIVEQAALKQIATFGVCERVGVHTCVCVCVYVPVTGKAFQEAANRTKSSTRAQNTYSRCVPILSLIQ